MLREIEEAVRTPGRRVVRLIGVASPSKAYLLAELRRRTGRPLLVVSPSSKGARSLFRDMTFFLGEPAPGLSSPHPLYLYPPWDVCPFEFLSPSPLLAGQRLAVLDSLRRGRGGVIVASLGAALQRVLPMALLQKASVELFEGASFDRDELLVRLARMGYQRTAMVEERGELAVRGAIVDAFSPQEPYPMRVEFMDERVCSIRYFNPSSQRSLRSLTAATFLPAREIVLDEESRLRGARALEAKGREAGLEEAHLSYFLERLEEEGFFPGIEGMLPLFLEELESLFDHLPPEASVVLDEPHEIAEWGRNLWESLAEEAALAPGRGLVSFDPELFWLKAETIYGLGERLPLLLFNSLPLYPQEDDVTLELRAETLPPLKGRLSAFAEQLKSWRRSGAAVVLVSPDRTRAIRLKGLLGEHELGASLLEEGCPIRAEEIDLSIAIGSISSSFSLKEPNLVLFREEDLFIAAMGAPRRKPPTQKLRPSLGELKEGDFVVHSEYGIAIYRGLCFLDWGGGEGEFLLLDYAGGDRLYVPTERAHLVQRYLAAGDLKPRLDKLGGTAWARVKRRVRESLRSMAEELLKLFAQRQVARGHSFSADDDLSRQFEFGFEHEETHGQLQAIQDVKADMELPRPMDRLVCGDVGYGKTEVAMRASFKAVMDGKQVAMLVPTTILAQQHYATFKKRFEPFPIRVEVLSRFRSRAEQQEVLGGLRAGLVDVVIGTHRLLQKDIAFANLGLLIIDEEHRFGVRHKEKLKSLKTSVDVLNLTATPIPRTLHLSLLGIRDLSVIETPPKERLSVRTYICRFSAKVIREAIDRELSRGGQVFFVHNRVQSIGAMARYLSHLVPHARIGIAHGQMVGGRLERVMLDFCRGDIDILLCSAIVESGLDIPAVNTIIINRADRFGMAQLYQLRGRVGRDRYQAHAYLLIPSTRILTSEARERLKALEELSELGSGFRLAARDMQIRGAGNILGREQSGHIAAVGFDLYCQLMEETVREVKGEAIPPQPEPELKLPGAGFIPESFIPSAEVRLEVYRRVASAASLAELAELAKELKDRFGPMPEVAERLLVAADIRMLSRACRVESLAVENGKALFRAAPGGRHLTQEFLSQPGIEFIDSFSFRVNLPGGDWREVFSTIKNTLQAFERCASLPPEKEGTALI